MSDEPGRDHLLDHSYDGIQEYDNPMPRWWVWIFYATIAFSILYGLNLIPGIGRGRGWIVDYEREVTEARAKYAALGPPGAGVSEPALIAMTKEPAKLAEGKSIFTTNCSPCHRADGGGLIGPNLTDDYWVHGGRPLEIVHTVVHGVQAKGMPAWGQILKPEQLPVVVAYVMSLHDTHPPNPKAPEGVKQERREEEPEAAR
jgi:cytochrome c oxidase cbb3-type subunit 3